ncbi:MAG: UDP-N-acetylglucosamine--N-acetylmuramyl-(pentapeptide) pyrophosphoryl-undecaprenol N-acetylglucosamine transferase, partial [Salinibacterium sp.]|nr:UDP-N-acetylglucosamine--N-acetylmuramyl-(pentapeptide) pyrophosphoryl-undecaprenol N-acetylglucosamine transferase [Salinibacterium sp.]
PVLLVTGGSLGAKSLNEFVSAFISEHAPAVRDLGWQVLHQAGGDQGASLEAVYNRAGIDAVVVPLLDPMGLAWGAAELAICRAGSGTVAEVAVNGVAAAFMPYPYHRDQHQAHNAEPLVKSGGSLLWDDHADTTVNLASHASSLLRLMEAVDTRESLRASLHGFRSDLPTGGASRVAAAMREQSEA